MPAGSLDGRMTIPEVTVDELAPIIEAGGRVIDVREPNEFDAGSGARCETHSAGHRAPEHRGVPR